MAAFVHSRCGDDFYLEDDQPILAQVLEFITDEDPNALLLFSKSFISLGDRILQQGNVEKIAFYGQTLITLCFNLAGNQKVIKEVQRVIN